MSIFHLVSCQALYTGIRCPDTSNGFAHPMLSIHDLIVLNWLAITKFNPQSSVAHSPNYNLRNLGGTLQPPGPPRLPEIPQVSHQCRVRGGVHLFAGIYMHQLFSYGGGQNLSPGTSPGCLSLYISLIPCQTLLRFFHCYWLTGFELLGYPQSTVNWVPMVL